MNIAATIRNWTHAIYWVVPRADKPRNDHYIKIGNGHDCLLKVDDPRTARSLEDAARHCAEAMEAEASKQPAPEEAAE